MKLVSKHIVQITPYYPPHLGGMENCAKVISEKLVDLGYRVSVITSDIGRDKGQIITHNKIKVFSLKSKEFAHTPISLKLFNVLIKQSNKAIFHIHIANAFFPEIAYIVAKIKKIKYVVHFHIDVESSGIGGFLLPLYKKFVLKNILLGASKIICLTSTQKELLVTKYCVNHQYIEVIPNGVDEKFFVKRTFRKGKNSIKKVLYVGRITKQKNIPLLLHVFKDLDNTFQLQLVGDGDLICEMKLLARKLKLKNIVWHGRKSDMELVSLYKDSDIFVLPSFNEGMSLSLLEAMAAGLPIVASNLPQNKDFLKDGSVLVPTLLPNDYCNAINDLIRNKEKMIIMSKKNQTQARDYRWGIIIEKIDKLYKDIYEN